VLFAEDEAPIGVTTTQSSSHTRRNIFEFKFQN